MDNNSLVVEEKHVIDEALEYKHIIKDLVKTTRIKWPRDEGIRRLLQGFILYFTNNLFLKI